MQAITKFYNTKWVTCLIVRGINETHWNLPAETERNDKNLIVKNSNRVPSELKSENLPLIFSDLTKKAITTDWNITPKWIANSYEIDT